MSEELPPVSGEKTLADLDNRDILEAFDGIASDLLAAEKAGGGRGNRIHIESAADAVFHTLGVKYSPAVFVKIREVLRQANNMSPRAQYIHV